MTDRGDLGLSIVCGLDEHLEPGDTALLYYASLFYHEVMVKIARHEGFAVRNHISPWLMDWGADRSLRRINIAVPQTARRLVRAGTTPR